MPRASVTPFQALRYSLLIKQMSCFKTGRTSGQIKNSRKPILWFYAGFRKGGKVFPIPLATVLKSDCVTLKNKQDNVTSTELLFARQLIPPQTNGKTARRTAQPSRDLKKLHHLFHRTRACCSFLQTSPSSLCSPPPPPPPGSGGPQCLPQPRWLGSPLVASHKFTAGLHRSAEAQRACWRSDGYSACRELRQENATLLRRQTGPLQSNTLQQVKAQSCIWA